MDAQWRRSTEPTPHLFVGGRPDALGLLDEPFTLHARAAGRLYATFNDAAAAGRALSVLRRAGIFTGFSEPAPPPAAASEASAIVTVPADLEAAGLRLHTDFVSEAHEAELIAAVDACPWDCSIHRRVQHYGDRFDYATKTVGTGKPPPLPAWVGPVLQLMRSARAVPWAEEAAADMRVQVTVNEYVPGVGIASHVDTHSAFEDGIAALSLGHGIGMKLQPHGAGEGAVLWLPPRSLLVFSGAARYAWRHGIATKKGDVVGGAWVARGRRVSLTLRRVRTGGAPCRCGWPEACDSQGAALQLPSRIGAGPRGGDGRRDAPPYVAPAGPGDSEGAPADSSDVLRATRAVRVDVHGGSPSPTRTL